MSDKELSHKMQVFAALKELVEKSQTIAICGHTSPDGDALGSALGLALGLRSLFPDKHIVNLLADSVDPGHIYSFLPGISQMVHAGDYAETPDLMIVVDLSVSHRLNDAQAVLKRAHATAILDHHPCEHPFGDVSYIKPDAAAAGVVIFDFLRYLGVSITPDIAQNLFCALMTDTGRFQYQNANPEAFEVASQLVNFGADPSVVSLNIYQNASLGYLHLKALVMGRITCFCNGKIAYSYATRADYVRFGVSLEESEGLVDAVRCTSGVEIVLFLKEVCDATIRGNLRSKSEIDISGVAASFGGGGHKAAAGFTIDTSLDEAFSLVLPKLQELITQKESL